MDHDIFKMMIKNAAFLNPVQSSREVKTMVTTFLTFCEPKIKEFEKLLDLN
jgi:hypothetical protein